MTFLSVENTMGDAVVNFQHFNTHYIPYACLQKMKSITDVFMGAEVFFVRSFNARNVWKPEKAPKYIYYH